MLVSEDKIARTYVLSQDTIAMIEELTKLEERNASTIVKRAIDMYYREVKK